MDSDALVESRIDDWQKFVEFLVQEGFEVTASVWFKATLDERWYHYLISPAVDSGGLTNAYRKLHPVIWSVPRPIWLDPLKVRLLGPSDPIAQDAISALSRPGVRFAAPTRWHGGQLGNTSIEEAYIFPVPTTAP